MLEGFSVTPPRLRLAAGRVRSSGRQLAAAGGTVNQTLEGLGSGSQTSAAAVGLASAVRAEFGALAAAIETLAAALDAAGTRYETTDAMIAALTGRQ